MLIFVKSSFCKMLNISSSVKDIWNDDTITFSPMKSEILSSAELPSNLQQYIENFVAENEQNNGDQWIQPIN